METENCTLVACCVKQIVVFLCRDSAIAMSDPADNHKHNAHNGHHKRHGHDGHHVPATMHMHTHTHICAAVATILTIIVLINVVIAVGVLVAVIVDVCARVCVGVVIYNIINLLVIRHNIRVYYNCRLHVYDWVSNILIL